MKGFGAFLLTGYAFFLSGCATIPVEIATAPVTEFFDLHGRISVRSSAGIESAAIHWRHTKEEERIQVLTPLGSVVAELVKPAEGRATLTQGDSKPAQEAESIPALAAALFGVPIDTTPIAHWVQGETNGETLIDSQAKNITTADGAVWQVSAEKFRVINNHRVATRVTAVNGDKIIKLVIDEWEPL